MKYHFLLNAADIKIAAAKKFVYVENVCVAGCLITW